MSGEGPRPIEELEAAAEAILAATAAAQATVRIMGGVAVRLRAADLGGLDPGRRVYHDVDLVGRLREVRAIDSAMVGLGYTPDRAINAQFGTVRRVYYDPAGWHVDLFFERLEFCHTIDLSGRLGLVARTTAPADLLLQKLQIVERNEKDVIDILWLLLNHALAHGDPEQIEVDRIVSLTSNDWGLFTTATEALAQAGQLVGQVGFSEAAAKAAADKLTELQTTIEVAPKSGRWTARARIGRRMKWYRTVEEVL